MILSRTINNNIDLNLKKSNTFLRSFPNKNIMGKDITIYKVKVNQDRHLNRFGRAYNTKYQRHWPFGSREVIILYGRVSNFGHAI